MQLIDAFLFPFWADFLHSKHEILDFQNRADKGVLYHSLSLFHSHYFLSVGSNMGSIQPEELKKSLEVQ